MLILPPSVYRRSRRVKAKFGPAASGPVLVAATYVSGESVTLGFAQPITVTADSMNAVAVYDGDAGYWYMGDDFAIVSPTQIRISLYPQESWPASDPTMTVQQPTGIMDAGNSIEWGGVTDVALPFGG